MRNIQARVNLMSQIQRLHLEIDREDRNKVILQKESKTKVIPTSLNYLRAMGESSDKQLIIAHIQELLGESKYIVCVGKWPAQSVDQFAHEYANSETEAYEKLAGLLSEFD